MHTQHNASDLRGAPYPSCPEILLPDAKAAITTSMITCIVVIVTCTTNNNDRNTGTTTSTRSRHPAPLVLPQCKTSALQF